MDSKTTTKNGCKKPQSRVSHTLFRFQGWWRGHGKRDGGFILNLAPRSCWLCAGFLRRVWKGEEGGNPRQRPFLSVVFALPSKGFASLDPGLTPHPSVDSEIAPNWRGGFRPSLASSPLFGDVSTFRIKPDDQALNFILFVNFIFWFPLLFSDSNTKTAL